MEPRKRRTPAQHGYQTARVFDCGAMSIQLNPKTLEAVQRAHEVVIPTLTDQRTVRATVAFAKRVARHRQADRHHRRRASSRRRYWQDQMG